MRTRLALLAAALAAFGGSLASGFHFDDYAIFPSVGAHSLWWCLQQTRPLTYLTFWLNYEAGGQNPLGYHAVNLALHLAAVLLLYEALRRLLPHDAAAFAAAIFAVHPIQAESVDYIWGRSIVLAAVFCFASLLAWIRGRPWTAVAWFAAALLSKEECAAFPLALFVLPLVGQVGGGTLWVRPIVNRPAAGASASYWLRLCRLVGQAILPAAAFQAASSAPAKGVRQHWPPHITMLALSFLAGVRVIYATAVTPGAPAGFQAGISPFHYLLAQGPVIWRYLRLLVAPIGFSVDPAIAIPPLWLGILAWAGIAVLAWRSRWLLIGFILLLPSSSIFPAEDLAADRRMYLPLAAFAAAAALAIPKKISTVIAIALIALSMGRTYVWMSDERLWREAAAHAPNKVRPKIQLSRNVPPPEALDLLAQARKLAPQDPAIATETGKVLLAQGNAALALSEFGRALALAPHDAQNYNNRGVALQALGLTEAARQDYLRALALDPGLTEARRNLERLGR